MGRGRKEFIIPDKISRGARRDRQAAEFERNQQDLRDSIATSRRLVDEADAMIRRHRAEMDEAENDEAENDAEPETGAVTDDE